MTPQGLSLRIVSSDRVRPRRPALTLLPVETAEAGGTVCRGLAVLQNADIGREHFGEAQTEGVGEACSQNRPAKFLCAVDLAVEGIALPVCWDVLSFFKTHVAIAKDSVLSASSGSALRFGDNSNLALVVVLVVTKSS